MRRLGRACHELALSGCSDREAARALVILLGGLVRNSCDVHRKRRVVQAGAAAVLAGERGVVAEGPGRHPRSQSPPTLPLRSAPLGRRRHPDAA